MQRTAMILVLGLLAPACDGSGDAADDDTTGTTGGSVDGSSSSSTTTTSTASTTTGPACTPGTEGCACDEGTCEGELACYSEICVVPPGMESSGGVDASTSSSVDSTGATESSGSLDASSSGSSESSSTGAPAEPCEEEGNHLCAAGVLDTCEDGVLTSQSCDDACAQTGYLSTGCADINGCACAGYADATCENITGKFCNCYALLGSACDADFEQTIYNYCFDPTTDPATHDIVVCFGDFPTDTVAECNAASDVCYNL